MAASCDFETMVGLVGHLHYSLLKLSTAGLTLIANILEHFASSVVVTGAWGMPMSDTHVII